MYIFRWLMKHPVIILALYFLSIVAILYSMTGGGSSDTDVVDTTQVEMIDSTEVDLTEAPTIEPSTLTSALVNEEATEKSVEVNDTEVTDSETSEVVDSSDAPVVNGEAEEETIAEDEVVDKPATVDETDKATEASAVLDKQFDEMSDQELLLMAREAYWNNGLDESAQIYQQLITLSPDVVDYKGELGNVLWRQGYPKKAAALYSEIALPMIAEGNADRVANMVGFIGLFFPEKATEIHNALQAAK